MSKVKKITVSNLKAVSSLTATFEGCTAIITGGNNKGKSSFLKSLPERLRGIKPDVILKQGEKEGFTEWELTTGEKFLWEFDGKKEKLSFTSERNIRTSISKDLSTYYFPAIFDVDEFLNSTPAKQKAALQKLTGIDFSEIDRMYKDAYENRTYCNRQLADAKAKLVLVEPNLPTEVLPTEDLEKELAGIDSHNSIFNNNKILLDGKKQTVAENDQEIQRLTERIAALTEKNGAINADMFELEFWLKDEANIPKSEDHVTELHKKLTDTREKNKLIADNNKAIEQRKEYEKVEKFALDADLEVKKIEQDKADVIKNASMPDGFGFDEDGITYKGFAFNKEQLSSSGLYIAALKLAAIGLGEVKTLHFDASFLDKQSLLEIEMWANDNDLQLLIERPDFEGGEIEYQIVQSLNGIAK